MEFFKWSRGGVIAEKNGGVNTSKNLPLNKNNNKIGKTFQKTFPKLLKLTKDFTAIQWAFIQEEWLNLGKNSKLCGILTCSTLIPTLSSVITLKNTRWHSQDWREQNRVRPLSKLYPKELSTFDPSSGSLEYFTQKPCLYLTSELCSVKSLFVYVC